MPPPPPSEEDDVEESPASRMACRSIYLAVFCSLIWRRCNVALLVPAQKNKQEQEWGDDAKRKLM